MVCTDVMQYLILNIFLVGFFSVLNLSVSISQTSTTPKNNLDIEINNDSLVATRGDIELFKIYLKPIQKLRDSESIEDQAFVIANCVVILRNVHVKGAYCHLPSIDKVEVYTATGARTVYNKDKESKIYPTAPFLQNFYGNKYSNHDRTFGLISLTAEGQLYGFMVIKSDGSIKEIPLIEKRILSDFRIEFFDDKVALKLFDYNKRYELVINANGQHEMKELNLRLTEHGFWPLRPPYTERNLSLEVLRGMFNDYMVKKGIGRQDGPNFLYYQILKGNDEIAFIKMDTDDTTKIERLFIRNAEISDEYGIKIGDTYKEIKKKRQNIKFVTYHFHTYAYVDNSNIGYEISGNFEGPDRQDFKENEILNWKVKSLIWYDKNGKIKTLHNKK